MIPAEVVLAEILRLQRWAGGDSALAARMHGLLNGFETIIRQENESFGVSEEIQEKVEDIIDEVERGEQSADGWHIKQRLLRDDIDETVASKVIKQCMLEGRFGDGIEKLISDSSHFSHLKSEYVEELQWTGALHYIELVDTTENSHKKLHGCFAPGVPRVGDVITPENGEPMVVTEVEWQAYTPERETGGKARF